MSAFRFHSALPVALAILASGCNVAPQIREATHLRKGKSYLESGDFRKAAIEFRVAAQNMPKDAEPAYQLGLAYLSGGFPAAGIYSFRRALSLNPSHDGAKLQIALLQVGSDKAANVAEARTLLSKWLSGHPGDRQALAALAVAEAKLGNASEAILRTQQALDADPSTLSPAITVMMVLAGRNDLARAKELARNLAARLPASADAAAACAELGMAIHDLNLADSEIRRALTLNPAHSGALQLKARYELARGDPHPPSRP